MRAAPAAQAMHEDHYSQFEDLLRATFSLYAGRKIGDETIRAYWKYLGGRMLLQELPGALRSACAESPTFPPTAVQIADCAARARAHQQSLQQADSVLGRRKQLAGKSDEARWEMNQREIGKVLAMLNGKMGM